MTVERVASRIELVAGWRFSDEPSCLCNACYEATKLSSAEVAAAVYDCFERTRLPHWADDLCAVSLGMSRRMFKAWARRAKALAVSASDINELLVNPVRVEYLKEDDF